MDDSVQPDGMRVCGVDPGLGVTGYAVLELRSGRHLLLDAGVCRTDARMDLPFRLKQLREDLFSVLQEFKPDHVAVEQLYAHVKHPRTAILMGHARGAMLCLAAELEMNVIDMPATQVKRFLTGNGHASKAQMQRAIMVTLGLDKAPQPPDVSDAIAVALSASPVAQRCEMMREDVG